MANKTETLMIKLSERDKKELRRQAEEHQMNMSEYVVYLIRKGERNMKTVAVTTLIYGDEEIRFIEKSDGTYRKVIDETEESATIEDLQELINTGKYNVSETMF